MTDMPAGKLFTYDDRGDEETPPHPRTPEEISSLLRDYCPVDKVMAVWLNVCNQNIWLGIGERESEVVRRWEEKTHPLLPHIIKIRNSGSISEFFNLLAADVAPITQNTLYNEMRQLTELCKLSSDPTIKSKIKSIKSITVKPAWKYPLRNETDIGTNVNLDGDFACQLKEVAYEKLQTLAEAIVQSFTKILSSFDLTPQHPREVEKDKCKPSPDIEGLCGAWYLAEVQYVVKNSGNGETKNLKVRIPVGLLRKPASSTTGPEKVLFGDDKANVYTYGLNFRFLCEGTENQTDQRSYVMQLKSNLNFLNARLNPIGLATADISTVMDPINEFIKDELRSQWQASQNSTNKEKLAAQISPKVVGAESLAIFTETGIHLLKNKIQIGAVCAKNNLLDKLFYAPPWNGTAPWLDKDLGTIFNSGSWTQASGVFPGGRECLEDDVPSIGNGSAKDYSQQLLTVYASKNLGLLDESGWNEYFKTTIREFREKTSGERGKFIDDLWDLLTTAGKFKPLGHQMYEPPQYYEEGERDSLPTGWRPGKAPADYTFTWWRDYCVGFRIEGGWDDTNNEPSDLKRYQQVGQDGKMEGMTQWRFHDEQMLKIRKLTFKDTTLDGSVPANAGVARMWNVNNDTFNETAVCVSRNLFGATKFPDKAAKGKYALFAVDCYDCVGYDTEHYQRNLPKGNRVWRPGEKAFRVIPYENVIGWVWVEKLGLNSDGAGWKFRIDEKAKWKYNPQWLIVDQQRKLNIKNYLDLELRFWIGEHDIPFNYDFRSE